ncbi:hypothetical protein GQR58_016012 [Nymphon striatum]|nr:hypothetical protein GQR58_016012 [Nymphon striatum]
MPNENTDIMVKSQLISSSLQLINKYNGEDTRGPIIALFSDLDNLTKQITQADDGFKIILLKSRLEGRALEYFHDIYQQKLSYKEIKDLLRKKFQPEPNLRVNYQNLVETRQLQSEDIISYATRLERRVKRLMPQVSDTTAEVKTEVTKIWDDICLGHFIEGLLPSLKGIVLMKEPKTLPQAIREAEKAEEITKSTNILPTKNVGRMGQEQTLPADSTESQTMASLIQHQCKLMAEWKQDFQQQANALREEMAHLRGEPTVNVRDERIPPVHSSYNPRGLITCYACGKLGHIARECRNKPQGQYQRPNSSYQSHNAPRRNSNKPARRANAFQPKSYQSQRYQNYQPNPQDSFRYYQEPRYDRNQATCQNNPNPNNNGAQNLNAYQTPATRHENPEAHPLN